MERGRLEAFSDGVFSVAVTLLALNLSVAGPGHGLLLNQLIDRWPAFLAYLISFFTVGIIWVNHHAVVQNLAIVNRTLLFLNLTLLLFVVMIPFATATMADYLTADGEDAQVAMALYALVFLAMGLSFGALFEWTLHPGRTRIRMPEAARRAARWQFSVGSLVYLLAIGIAFVSPQVALAVIGLVAVYYVFERTPSSAPSRTQRSDEG